MQNTTLLIILGLFVVLGAALILAQNRPVGTAVSTDDGTRVEAPGVDITVPRDKDGD